MRSAFLPALDLLPNLGLIAVLAVGGHRVLNGQMTPGEMLEFMQYIGLLIFPLRNLGMTVAFGQRAAAALLRVNEVLSTVPAVHDAVAPVALPDGDRVGEVSFAHVAFGYDGNNQVLRDFDLRIPAGASVAVVGATGSGKSTVARLLVRFYDVNEGAICIDGVDVRDLTLADLRHAVAIVFEDTFLFHDTVAANIAFSRPDASHADVEAAARLAGAHDFILDEATSAVDPSKEHEIREAMTTVMQGRTTIVIAHRPGTIALADTVVLLDEGQVVATGTHDELLATSERYRAVLAALADLDDAVDGDADGDTDRDVVVEVR